MTPALLAAAEWTTPRPLPGTPDWLCWRYPWLLLLLLLLPALWFLWLTPTRRTVIRFSSLSALRAAGGVAARRLRLVLPALRTAALACLIVAAARPQRPDETSRVFAEGVAIQMVVDTSSSMGDLDLSPRGATLTRLDVVKEVFRRFVMGDDKVGLPGRKNDLIGMIRFARYADSVCPLTLDRDNLLEVLDQSELVRAGHEEDGTAIGNALAFAVNRMRELKRTVGSGQQLTITSRAIILLTDGEDNLAEIQQRWGADDMLVSLTPEQAGDLAATYGIKVYTILAGTGRSVGLGFRQPVDDRQLRHIADVTGGKHFHARDANALVEIYKEIDRLERTKTEERTFLRWGELSWPWLLAAFVCLSVQTLLDATWLRKIP